MDVRSVAFQATVSGRVQGVGFRYFTQAAARELGITGWVKNEGNGTVSVYAEGSRERLGAFIERLREGPSFSTVRKVDVRWMDSFELHTTFRINF